MYDNIGPMPCFALVNFAPECLTDKLVGKHKIRKKY